MEEITQNKMIENVNQESGKISFMNVNLRYDEHKQPSLKNVTFDIFPGRKVGIVGKSGAGKSSVIQVIN